MTGKIVPISDATPGHLSAEARRLWRDVARDFSIDDAAGLALLLQLCEALDSLRECQKRIKTDGLATKGSRNQIRAHPLLTHAHEFRRQFISCCRALNLDLAPPK